MRNYYIDLGSRETYKQGNFYTFLGLADGRSGGQFSA